MISPEARAAYRDADDAWQIVRSASYDAVTPGWFLRAATNHAKTKLADWTVIRDTLSPAEIMQIHREEFALGVRSKEAFAAYLPVEDRR